MLAPCSVRRGVVRLGTQVFFKTAIMNFLNNYLSSNAQCHSLEKADWYLPPIQEVQCLEDDDDD